MFLLGTLFFFVPFLVQEASASPSVDECLEDDVNCEELDTLPDEMETDGNDFLVEDNTNDSLALDIVKMFFALLLVLALIYVAIKFLGKRNNLFSQVKSLENLGGISLGPSRSIQIIRVGSKVYLIGVGENVELLEEITDQQIIHDLLRNKENTTGLFQMSSFTKKKSENMNSSNFKNLFSAELDKLKQSRKNIINQHKEDNNHE